MPTRRVLALLVGAKAATTAKAAASWATSAQAAEKDVPEHVPTEMPDDGFPGPDTDATSRSWPSGQQPKRLAAWPQTWDSDGKRTLEHCGKVTVLQDTKLGWPGLCMKLFGPPHTSKVTSEGLCQKICTYDSRCAVWQFVNQTTPGQCWVGFGEDCIWRGGEGNAISVQGAQRLMHGEVRVLKNLTGWKISNLYNIPMHNEGNVDVSILRCKAWCYSSIHCEYWQYGPGGCWVDAPLFTTARGTDPDNRVQYPMTTNGGCTNTTSEASAMMWGEYIQHYCPPESAPQVEEDRPQITLGSAVAEAAQPTQDGVLGMPTWVMVAILLGLAMCVVLCVYSMSQQGSKRETSKTSRTTRAMQMSAEYQEELAMDSMVDSSMVDASPNARSVTPSEYSDDGAMNGVPPAPAWEPLTTAPAMQPGTGYGTRDLNASQAHSQHSWWHGGQHGGQHHPHQFAPTQRLDMPPPPNPYEQGARGAHLPGVPFPAPPPPYHGQSAPQYGHYPRHSAQQPGRWY